MLPGVSLATFQSLFGMDFGSGMPPTVKHVWYSSANLAFRAASAIFIGDFCSHATNAQATSSDLIQDVLKPLKLKKSLSCPQLIHKKSSIVVE